MTGTPGNTSTGIGHGVGNAPTAGLVPPGGAPTLSASQFPHNPGGVIRAAFAAAGTTPYTGVGGRWRDRYPHNWRGMIQAILDTGGGTAAPITNAVTQVQSPAQLPAGSPAGSTFWVHQTVPTAGNPTGNPLNMLAVATPGQPAAGPNQPAGYRFHDIINRAIHFDATRPATPAANPVPQHPQEPGALTFVTEADHQQIWVSNGTDWLLVSDADSSHVTFDPNPPNPVTTTEPDGSLWIVTTAGRQAIYVANAALGEWVLATRPRDFFPWDPADTYLPGNLVEFNGSLYIADPGTTPAVGVDPATDNSWTEISGGQTAVVVPTDADLTAYPTANLDEGTIGIVSDSALAGHHIRMAVWHQPAGAVAGSWDNIRVEDPLPWQDPAGAQDAVSRDWMLTHCNWFDTVARVGNLPDTSDPLHPIRPGAAYLIKQTFHGAVYNRLVVYDDTRRGTGGIKSLGIKVDPRDVAAVQARVANGFAGANFVLAPMRATGRAASVDVLFRSDGTALATNFVDRGQNFHVGQQYSVRPNNVGAGMDFQHDLILTVGEITGPNPHGGWRYINLKNIPMDLAADPKATTDRQEGDFTSVLENQAKELWTYHGGHWVKLFGEREIKGWISSLSLFMGTTEQIGGTHAGAVPHDQLPDLTALTAAGDLTKVAHYWTWVGDANHVVQPGDAILSPDLDGAVLEPGDWVQISNRGGDGSGNGANGGPVDLHWVTVGGDLLSKARGDNLFGLNPYVPGSWENGSTVVHNNAIYKAQRDVVAGDPAPGDVVTPPAVNPWQKVDLSAGVRWVPDDNQLPATGAPDGEVWFVLSSARAGSAGALYYWDQLKASWEPLVGESQDLALSLVNGTVVYERPLPPWDETGTRPNGKFDGDLLFHGVSKNVIERWDQANTQWVEIFRGPGQIWHQQWTNIRCGGINSHQLLSNPSAGVLRQNRRYKIEAEVHIQAGDADDGQAGIRVSQCPDLEMVGGYRNTLSFPGNQVNKSMSLPTKMTTGGGTILTHTGDWTGPYADVGVCCQAEFWAHQDIQIPTIQFDVTHKGTWNTIPDIFTLVIIRIFDAGPMYA